MDYETGVRLDAINQKIDFLIEFLNKLAEADKKAAEQNQANQVKAK